jgi:hypothetical protein
MQNEFVARLEAAAKSTEPDRASSILFTSGLPPAEIKIAEKASDYTLSEIQKYKDKISYSWSSPSPEFTKPMEANGFQYIPNLNIVTILTVTWDIESNSHMNSSFGIGINEGKLWIAGSVKKPIKK